VRAVLRLVHHELSARWRSWVLLGLLVGIAGGAVLTAIAGARRTDSAYSRFLVASRAADVFVAPFNTGLDGYYRALGRLPDVTAIGPFVNLNATPLGPDGRAVTSGPVVVPADGTFGRRLEIPKFLAGRMPRADRPGEVAVSQIGANSMHLHVGSTLVLGACAGQVCSRANSRRLRERVVGIFVTPSSVLPVTDIDKLGLTVASPALLHQLVQQFGPGILGFDAAFVKLRRGVSTEHFARQAQDLARVYASTGGQVLVADEAAQAATIERSIRPQALALAIFALVLAITALLSVGNVASRLLFAASSDYPTLVALGMTRMQLLAAGLAEVGAIAMAGAVAAVGAAVAASPLMPIGAARLAEPSPGVSADTASLATGAALITILVVARAAWPAWRLASAGLATATDPAAGRQSRAARWFAGAGTPVIAVTGVRFALESGRGRSAMPVRSAVIGTALPVLAVMAAFTFGANLLHLVHSPRLYGQSWDVAIDLQFQTITPQQTQHLVGRATGLTGWSYGDLGVVEINGQIVPAIGVAPGQGPLVSPTLLDGRPPRTGHEIVLGTSVLRRIGRAVGQLVIVTVNGDRELDRIVGRAVFPNFGQGSFTPTNLGVGAETTAAVLQGQASFTGKGPHYDFVLLRFSPGRQQGKDIVSFTRSMARFCGTVQQTTCLVANQRPYGVTTYLAIDGTPEVLAVLLAGLGLGVLGQLVVTSVRRRRRDFAIMKALGMLRRQVRLIIAWQLTTVTVLALLVGLPAGVALGRWAWLLFAAEIGVGGNTVTPLGIVLVLMPAAVLTANAVAFWPARRAALLSPAEVLHAQ
jgi:FtsX-like permease family